MATRSSEGLAGLLLQVSLGLYIGFLGLNGIIGYDSDRARIGRAVSELFGASNSPLGLVISISQLVLGLLLILGIFIFAKRGSQILLGLIALGLWGAFMLFQYFVGGVFSPDTITWFTRFSLDLVVLAGLFVVSSRKSRIS